MKLRQARFGEFLQVNRSRVEFSFWPVRSKGTKKSLQTHVQAKNPWGVIKNSIRSSLPNRIHSAAFSFIDQAEDFFSAAMAARTDPAKPLLLYYFVLNIVKALILSEGSDRLLVDRAMHGLSESTDSASSPPSILVHSSESTYNVFPEFIKINAPYFSLTNHTRLLINDLESQIIFGHRLWADALSRKEHFIPIEDINIMRDAGSSEIWVRFCVKASYLNRQRINHTDFITKSNLSGLWTETKPPINSPENQDKLLWFEQKNGFRYQMFPAEKIEEAIASLKANIWSIAINIPPHRKYYLWLNHNDSVRLPQLSTLYAFIFYLGSITRYRPHKYFDLFTKTKKAAFLQEVISVFPTQFLYLIASEFAKRDVTNTATI